MPVVRPCGHRSAHWQPLFLQLLVCLKLASVLAAGSGPSHYKCACNQSLTLHRYLELALTGDCVHSTGSSHHQWCLTAGPRSTQQSLQALWTLHSIYQRPHSCWCYGSQLSEPLSSCHPEPGTATCPHTWHPSPLDLGSQHALVCPCPQVKVFSCQSQSITSRRGDFFKCADTYARLWMNIMKYQGHMAPLKKL